MNISPLPAGTMLSFVSRGGGQTVEEGAFFLVSVSMHSCQGCSWTLMVNFMCQVGWATGCLGF